MLICSERLSDAAFRFLEAADWVRGGHRAAMGMAGDPFLPAPRRGFTQSSRNLHSGFRAGFYPLERNDQFHLEGKSEAFNVSDAWKAVFDGNQSFIQAQFVWLIVIALACWYILERTRLGNHLFASGGNSVAAKAAGVNVDRTKVIAFMITGFLAAFSGIVSTVRVTTVSPVQGEGIELEAIAACVIGGTALMGGRGSIIGPFLGAALLYSVQDILLLVRAPGSYLKLFLGIIIVVAVIVNKFAVKKEE
jgi:ribose/xylose/arabinose/galactoside ABC-type transport system permease subunit